MTEWSFFMQNANFEVNEELPISMLHNASVSSREKHTPYFSLPGCRLKKNWRDIYPRSSPEKSGTNWSKAVGSHVDQDDTILHRILSKWTTTMQRICSRRRVGTLVV
jgi:hypothetical protein